MKAKTFFFSILFLFLASTILVSCETPEADDQTETELNGVDRNVDRPGSQG